MRKSHEYFLALAKTLHFTQAASQLYISQQALSDQIKRLEEELDVQLFIRKPKLKLSPEGELLQSKLYEMQRMEQELYYEMRDLKQTSRGSINIGMHDARAKVLLPLVLKKFHSEYPHVVVKIVSDHTQNYGKRLAEGEVDFFFGINAEVGNELQEEILANEPMVLIVPNQLLKTMFSDHLEEKLAEFSKGADLRYFSDVPFIFGLPISQGQQSINKYLNRIGIHLQVPLFLNVYASQFLLLNIYSGACFCPQMLVSLIKQYNLAQPKESQLQAFPLLDFQEWLVLSLIRYKDAYLPYYAERFYQITKETVLSLVNNPLTALL